MRRISIFTALLFVLFTLFGGTLFAQKLTVEKFELRERDLSAKVKPRDAPVNGDPCALVRVQVAAPNCIFNSAYIVGEVEQGFGEYLVYMAKGARNLRISHPDFLFTPLDFTFPEPLEGRLTYALILEVPIYTHYAEIVEQQSQNAENKVINQITSHRSSDAITSQTESYQVGDYYNENGKEGVVFWVDESGKHGKIVSIIESSFLQWSSHKASQKNFIGCYSSHRGGQNMDVIMKISGWREKFPAFAWCADLGEGWYLPAEEELLAISRVLDLVNRTLAEQGAKVLSGRGGFYLSSSESEIYKRVARLVNVKKGEVYDTHKGYNQYVRAVYAF